MRDYRHSHCYLNLLYIAVYKSQNAKPGRIWRTARKAHIAWRSPSMTCLVSVPARPTKDLRDPVTLAKDLQQNNFHVFMHGHLTKEYEELANSLRAMMQDSHLTSTRRSLLLAFILSQVPVSILRTHGSAISLTAATAVVRRHKHNGMEGRQDSPKDISVTLTMGTSELSIDSLRDLVTLTKDQRDLVTPAKDLLHYDFHDYMHGHLTKEYVERAIVLHAMMQASHRTSTRRSLLLAIICSLKPSTILRS